MHTTLWTPDIAPPNRWLYPAILYEDSIGTVVPLVGRASEELPALNDELRRTHRLRELLGDGYKPCRLTSVTLTDELKQALEASVNQTERYTNRSRALSEWWGLEHAEAQSDILLRQRDSQVQRHREEFESIRARFVESKKNEIAALEQRRHDLKLRQERLAEEREKLQAPLTELASERKRRKALVSEELRDLNARLGAAMKSQRENPLDDQLAVEIASLRSQMISYGRSIEKPEPMDVSEVTAEEARIQGELSELERDEARLWKRLKSSKQWRSVEAQISMAEQEYERARRGTRGALTERLADQWKRNQLSSGWDFIMASKVPNDVVGYLHELGFLYHTFKSRSGEWLKVLFAPRVICVNVLNLLAESFCEENSWVPMGALDAVGKNGAWARTLANNADLADLEMAVTSFLLSLPCPPDDVPLEAVVEFRNVHEVELRQARDALRKLIEVGLADEDSLRYLGHEVEAALSEVGARLSEAVKRRRDCVTVRIREAVKSRDGKTVRGLGSSAMIGIGTGLVIGTVENLIDSPQSPLAALGSSLTPGSVSAMVGTTVFAESIRGWGAWRKRRGLAEDGLRYLYDVQRAFTS